MVSLEVSGAFNWKQQNVKMRENFPSCESSSILVLFGRFLSLKARIESLWISLPLNSLRLKAKFVLVWQF